MLEVREVRNARLPISGELVCIRHSGGMIVGVGKETSHQATHIDVQGLTVVPGLNAMHVHGRVPGQEHKEGWQHLSLTALYGGVVAVGDQPNDQPPCSTYGRFLRKVALIGAQPIRRRFYFGATESNFDDFFLVADHPLCGGLKIFMGSSEGVLLVSDPHIQLKWFHTVALKNKRTRRQTLALVHSVDEAIVRQNRDLFENPTVADHARIRTKESAIVSTERALWFQELTGCPLMILHVTTVEEAQMIKRAKQKGQEVYAEACPHSWVFTQEDLSKPDGARKKINPPSRGLEDREKYLELVCEPGVFDTIAPDHAPHTESEKSQKAYDKIPSGMPGLQELFPVAFTTLVKSGRMSLERFIELTSTNAARIFGLPNGRIEVGYAADLMFFDPDEQFVLRDEDMQSKCGWTAYHGMQVYGRPRMVMVGGVIEHNLLELLER
jgi:dihydroorotase